MCPSSVVKSSRSDSTGAASWPSCFLSEGERSEFEVKSAEHQFHLGQGPKLQPKYKEQTQNCSRKDSPLCTGRTYLLAIKVVAKAAVTRTVPSTPAIPLCPITWVASHPSRPRVHTRSIAKAGTAEAASTTRIINARSL